jgi:hypothetical protein
VLRNVPPSLDQLPGHPDSPHLAWTKEEDVVVWPRISLHQTANLANNMVRVTGGSFREPRTTGTGPERNLPDFFVDPTEFTQGDVYALSPAATRDSEPTAPLQPLTSVSWDRAVAYAEWAGKRLPTKAEFEYLATAGGTRKFTTGDAPPAEPALDTLVWERVNFPVQGLCSEPLEWIWDPPAVLHARSTWRHVAGIPAGDGGGKPASAQVMMAQDRLTADPGIGFRCVRSALPLKDAAELSRRSSRIAQQR